MQGVSDAERVLRIYIAAPLFLCELHFMHYLAPPH